MKTFLASAFFALLITTAARAQDHPYLSSNRAFVGGGLSFGIGGNVPDDGNPNISQDNSRLSWSVSPTYGRFYNDRWAAGVSFNVGSTRNQQEITTTNTLDQTLNQQTVVGITPFLRRFLPITERFGAFVQPEISYQRQVVTISQKRTDVFQPIANSYSEIINRRHFGSLGLRGGLYYFITEHFTVETNLGQFVFRLSSETNENTTANNQVDTSTKNTSYDSQLNLINQLSLDQIFILNYYF